MSGPESISGTSVKGEVTDTLSLIQLQNKRKNDVISLLTREIPGACFTRSQKATRLETLKKTLAEFRKTHDEILQKGKPDIPYIVNKLGEQTIAYIDAEIQKMENRNTIDQQDRDGTSRDADPSASTAK
jgi:hypothetical protein